jgi:hypothetical protein
MKLASNSDSLYYNTPYNSLFRHVHMLKIADVVPLNKFIERFYLKQ